MLKADRGVGSCDAPFQRASWTICEYNPDKVGTRAVTNPCSGSVRFLTSDDHRCVTRTNKSPSRNIDSAHYVVDSEMAVELTLTLVPKPPQRVSVLRCLMGGFL